MNDDDLIRELREATRRSDEAPTGTELDAPLGDAFQAQVAARIAAARRPRQTRRLWLAVAGPVAMAAAIALWIARPHATFAPLPEYAMEISGGQDSERGEDHAPRTSIVARADGSLTLLLRPANNVTGALAVHAFASHAGAVREVPATTRASSTGSVEVQGRVSDLAGADGATVIVVIARADSKVNALSIASGIEPAPADVKVAKVEVRIAR